MIYDHLSHLCLWISNQCTRCYSAFEFSFGQWVLMRSRGEKEWESSPVTFIVPNIHSCLLWGLKEDEDKSCLLCVCVYVCISVRLYECVMCMTEGLCHSTSVVQELNPQEKLLINIHVVHRCSVHQYGSFLMHIEFISQ